MILPWKNKCSIKCPTRQQKNSRAISWLLNYLSTPPFFFFFNKIRIMVISGEISRMFIEKPKGGQARITSFYGLTLDRILPERSNSPLLKPMEKREWAQRTWLSLTKTPKKHFRKVYCFFLIEMCSLTKWKSATVAAEAVTAITWWGEALSNVGKAALLSAVNSWQ